MQFPIEAEMPFPKLKSSKCEMPLFAYEHFVLSILEVLQAHNRTVSHLEQSCFQLEILSRRSKQPDLHLRQGASNSKWT